MDRKKLEKFKRELKELRQGNPDSVACEYCGLVRGEAPRTDCGYCGLVVCDRHLLPEDHECAAFDWDEIKAVRREESEERWAKAKRAIQMLRFQREARDIALVLVIGALAWLAISAFLGKPAPGSPPADERCEYFIPEGGADYLACESFCISSNFSVYSLSSVDGRQACRCCTNETADITSP